MRGEQALAKPQKHQLTGSSPHAWGTDNGDVNAAMDARVIPTCVGNSKLSALLFPVPSGHPHMRGEQI